MIKLELAPSKDHYLSNGKPFFYLADTVWATFATVTIEEWARYLEVRRGQGFNALQISILPITHDRSVPPKDRPPFLLDADGRWDFSRPDESYFDRAETMIEMAVKAGFLPVLMVLWCSYVPETRCSKGSPIPSAMELKHVKPYAAMAARRFKRFNPVMVISGDTKFESPAEAPFYGAALEAVKQEFPEALISMHLHPEGFLPAPFDTAVDFYCFQSGHHAEHTARAYTLAEKFRAYPKRVPVLNSEPCYEGHGRIAPDNSRWSQGEVRKAAWQSLMSGAKMGIAYGAHGVWSFHRPGDNFLSKKRSLDAFDWQDSLYFPGAPDMAYAKELFETHNLFALDPAAILKTGRPEARAMASADGRRFAIYLPSALELELDLDLTGFRVSAIDLARRLPFQLETRAGKTSRLMQPGINGDYLVMGVKG